MSIKPVQSITVAWALRPFPPLIPEGKRDTPEARDQYLQFAVDAVNEGTKYGDFYQWAVREGLTKDTRFFGKLLDAFKNRRYDKQGTQK